MKTQKQLEDLFSDMVIETSVQYTDAHELSNGFNAQAQETHIQGVVVNEGFVPGLQVSVRSSQAFTCIQPSHRDFAESSDFVMAPDIEWEFFHGDDRGKANDDTWDEAELIEALSSVTEMATFNPMLSVE
ncbi:hypothetical protein Q9252_15265 [Marinobacter salarius]|uniref:hypothetical protein n=1 Tax=Marinobacter salarius TaxID=1420917 RepID=UPI00273C63DC|nr:hypothetical protein [Marinobacter salarius]MDP4533504.1 hypothetical protein [Marinobacter salarius]